jgi:hypothetical protein
MRALVSRYSWWGVGVLAVFVPSRLDTLTGWDDAYYVGQLTSAVEDHDLLLQNDLLDTPRPEETRMRSVTAILDSGAVQNTFGVGFAVLHGAYAWPVLAFWHRGMLALRATLALGSMALLVVTFLATGRVVARFGVSAGAIRLATVLALASSPLAMYATRTYSDSHLTSAALSALMLLGFLRWLDSGDLRDAALTGLAAGLLTVTRWQDACLWVMLLPAGMGAVRNRGTGATFLGVAAGGAAAAAALLVQPLAWRIQFGSWLLVPQGGDYLSWTRPRLLELILSSYHGLLPWAPGLALGLVALALRPAGDSAPRRGLRLGLVLAAALTLYVSATPRDWWAGDSYGPRRLSSLAPLAAIGLGLLLDRLRRWAWWVLGTTMLGWTVFTMSLYFSGIDDLSLVATVRWVDSWGPLHSLKPGFSLSDAPSRIDQIVGGLIVVILVGVVGLAWDHVRRSPRFQVAAITFGLAWVVLCDVWLAVVVPTNARWNPRWRAVVLGESEAGLPPFPPSIETAAQQVRGFVASGRTR